MFGHIYNTNIYINRASFQEKTEITTSRDFQSASLKLPSYSYLYAWPDTKRPHIPCFPQR